MRLHSVLGGPIELFDAEVLLYPFEEKFDSPPCFVQLCNEDGLEDEVVGEEDKVFLRLVVEVVNAAYRLWVVLGRVHTREDDRLV